MESSFIRSTQCKSQKQILSLQKAIKKAEKYEKVLKKRDNQFALIRLMSTITLLAIIVGFIPKQDPVISLLMVVLFLIYCLITSFFHIRIQKKQKKWMAYFQSYSLSLSRITRDFKSLSENKSPWHDEISKVPNAHIYSSDLDIHTQLFLLFNTCTTKDGAKNLFKLFMEAGISPESTEKSLIRSYKANLLSKKTQMIRKFEALRLDENFLQKYFKLNDKNTPSEKNPQNKTFSNSIIQNLYSIISITAWIFILLPALIKFLNSPNTEALLQPLFIYAMFLITGVFIFSSVTENASKISQSSKTIDEVINALPKNNQLAAQLDFTFLEENARKQIKTLNLLIDLISLRGNPIFWLTLHIFFPFDAVICFLLQLKTKNFDKTLLNWERELHEFDILASFARFSIENPACRFLTKEERTLSTPQFIECINIGHPLIPTELRICNSIYIEKSSPVVLLTGSNMAGKSTFLRTLGINTLLANMGAPVCAEKFIIQPSRLLCAIRIDDSLSDGTSYFYAEVKRLRYILNSLNDKNLPPGIFLIDEIFRGTNNKERYVGSWHIIHALFEKNSFGFISTHDLALAELDKKDTRLLNMHFREHIENDKLVFDYLIKQGPCPTTNALYIMKQEGLPVPLNSLN